MHKLRRILRSTVGMLIAAAVMCSIPVATAETAQKNLSKGISPITGTFIQPWMYNSWSDKRWEQELTMLKELGVEYMVMGDVAQTRDGKWYSAYDSALDEFQGHEQNAVDKLMEMCDQYDIKVYLGMGVDGEWWGWDLSTDRDAASFAQAAEMSVKIAGELYSKYKTKYPDTYYGFYSVYEIWNHDSWDDEARREKYSDALSNGFNIILEGLNKIDPAMPLLFSPFATPSTDLASKESTKQFYIDFFTKTNFRSIDAIAPMDNIGGGGQSLETLEEWTVNYLEAVQESGNKLKFWSNCESFVQPTGDRINSKGGINWWGACTVERFIQQMDIVGKYAERVFNFAYPHYFSPYNNVPGYHEVYKKYLTTGEKDTQQPLPPNKIKITQSTWEGSEALRIEFSGMWDEAGISRVNVYKNGSLLDYRVSSRTDGGKETPQIPNYVYDTNSNTSVTKFSNYEFETVDCWGNVSERSKFRVYNDQLEIDMELDEPYTCLYVDDQLVVSAKPTEAFPTEYTVRDEDGPDQEKTPNAVWPWIIGGAAVVVAAAGVVAFVFIKRKKTKKVR